MDILYVDIVSEEFLSSNQVANIVISCWSLLASLHGQGRRLGSHKWGGDGGIIYQPAGIIILLEQVKIWCNVQEIIYPLLELKDRHCHTSFLISYRIQGTGNGRLKYSRRKTQQCTVDGVKNLFFHPYKIVFNISNSNVLQKRLKGLIHFLLYSALNLIMSHNNEKIPRSCNLRICYRKPRSPKRPSID